MPERERFRALAKQHEKLLRDIAKKRAALDLMREVAKDVMNKLAARTEPLRTEYEAVVGEVKRLFEALLDSNSRLSRRHKAEVRRIYADILDRVPPHLRPDPDGASDPSGAWDPAGPDESDGFSGACGTKQRSVPSEDAFRSEAGYSAPKHGGEHATTLRSLFRRLAIALHPDKVQDEKEKAERTAKMKELTRAYESGDVARLVELERSYLSATPATMDPDGLDRQIGHLLQANAELRRQLRKLTAEQKLVRQSVPFRLDLISRKRALARAEEEMETVLAELEDELCSFRDLRDFVQRFADGKMTMREFAAARNVGAEDVMDEHLEALALELLEEMDAFQAPPRRRRRGTS